MFIVRPARPDDLPILLKLARMVHFINLPADKEIISDKIRRSANSFAADHGLPARAKRSNDDPAGWKPALPESLYMFVIEDVATGNVLGTSQIIPQIGTPTAPHTFFQLRTRTMYADDLQQGATHVTLQLGHLTDGPTEVGGLILQPSLRGHPERLGKTLSLIRFHYIGLHRDRFRDELIAEMMAPLTSEGTNAFWEHVGRRFINLTYAEADRLSTRSKAFILKLMPKEEIYATLLPPEARIIIGRVGKETQPARALLERLGFEYRDQIDPFDGGPHLHAKTADVPLIRETKRVTLAGSCAKAQARGEVLVSFDGDDGFRAVRTGLRLGRNGSIEIPRACIAALGAEKGAKVGLTVLTAPEGVKRGRKAAAAAT